MGPRRACVRPNSPNVMPGAHVRVLFLLFFFGSRFGIGLGFRVTFIKGIQHGCLLVVLWF